MTSTPSDHFDGRRFVNPTGPASQPLSAVPRMLLEKRTPWPARVDAPLRTAAGARRRDRRGDLHRPRDVSDSDRRRKHPHRSDVLAARQPAEHGRAAAGPAAGRAFDDLPPISTILLSHNHYDHCDLPTLRKLAPDDPLVVTPLGNGRLVRSTGIRRVEELDWWQDAKTAVAPITLTPAHHFSARTPFDRNRALWGGFLLIAGGLRIYFAGDSAYAPHFREIRQRLGSDRSRAAADRRLRAALVHGARCT